MNSPRALRCFACARPLLTCAVPGLAIGPVCAKKRGLMPDRPSRAVNLRIARGGRQSAQVDWIRDWLGGHPA